MKYLIAIIHSMAIVAAISILLGGCGNDLSGSTPDSTAFDSSSCPTGEYGMVGDKINFLSSGSLTIEANFCHSLGTFVCTKSNKSLLLTVTSQDGGALAASCTPVGTYACTYQYGRDSSGFLQLLITCSDGSFETYDTTRLQ